MRDGRRVEQDLLVLCVLTYCRGRKGWRIPDTQALVSTHLFLQFVSLQVRSFGLTKTQSRPLYDPLLFVPYHRRWFCRAA